MGAPAASEDQIQRAVFAHIKQRATPGVFAFHPKNGGVHQRGRRRGINAGLGVVSGVPDVILVKPHLVGGILHGQVYGLELKTDTGKVTETQVETMQAMQRAGAVVSCVYGLDAALAKLEEWGLLKGRAR
jgi:hypothetical protein